MLRLQVVSTCVNLSPTRRQYVSCIGDKNVASLSPVCCWIQRDTSRPWHKWIVIMSSRYSLQVSRTNNLYSATCIRRHICIRMHVARPGYMLLGNMCPGVNTALGAVSRTFSTPIVHCPRSNNVIWDTIINFIVSYRALLRQPRLSGALNECCETSPHDRAVGL